MREMASDDISFLPKEMQEIAKKGNVCMVEESSFSDPGPDYTKYWVDGVCIHHQNGY
jgi:hypothetical protein